MNNTEYRDARKLLTETFRDIFLSAMAHVREQSPTFYIQDAEESELDVERHLRIRRAYQAFLDCEAHLESISDLWNGVPTPR